MDKKIIIASAVSAVAGGIVGGAITFITVKKRLEQRYSAESESAIEDVKRHYALLHAGNEAKREMFNDMPEEEMNEAREVGERILRNLHYGQTQSIFDRQVKVDEEGNLVEDETEEETEEDPRDSEEGDIPVGYVPVDGEPYLITQEEFFENVDDYEMDTLTYFEVDDTLCDEKNAQINEVESTIGARHLTMFVTGNGKTRDSLYIRNDDHKSLYEVLLVKESYASVILGVSDEDLGLKEPKTRPKKMRNDD